MLAAHRRQLHGVAVGERPQQLPDGCVGINFAEHLSHTAGTRISSTSAMLSAPAHIPAINEVSFPAGFTPAERTFVGRNTSFVAISSDSPACFASARPGARPAHDTKSGSLNTAVDRDHS